MNGKAYANRKPKEKRKPSDFYETPISLTKELLNTGVLKGVKSILDPCCGKYAIGNVLKEAGFNVTEKDLIYGDDFLNTHNLGDWHAFDAIVMNPPFSKWDDFVLKSKAITPIVVALGKPNFFGAQSRYNNGIWKHLKTVYIFTRQVDYQFPVDPDGNVGVGNLITGWFVWDSSYNGDPTIKLIDVNKYCKLGGFDSYVKKHPELKQDLLETARKKELL